MNTNKNTKRRLKRAKKSNFKRLLIIASILLICVMLGFLSLVSIKHFNAQETQKINVVNIKKADKNITNIEKNKPKKDDYKLHVKFSKDENLSKIFINPNSIDETPFLNQIDKKEQKKPQILDKKPKILEPKPKEQKPSNFPLIKIEKPNKTEQNTTILNKLEQNRTKPTDKNQTIIKTEQKPPKNKKIKKEPQVIKTGIKPKLAIIIDDVANKNHVDMIRSTGLKKLIPSFFPKSSRYPNTPKLAMDFEFYMIHLPMQANSFKNEEIDTLRVGESQSSIERKIARIRADFKNAKFINNHTGSRFTSDFNSIDKAFKILNKYGFIFIDSRTIATTKVREVAKKHAKPYIMRDVFLDDKNDKKSIKKSLDEAIACAKRNGYAIAIGHPKKNTIDVLSQNKDYILKNVELVYISEIYDNYK